MSMGSQNCARSLLIIGSLDRLPVVWSALLSRWKWLTFAYVQSQECPSCHSYRKKHRCDEPQKRGLV